MNSWRRKNKSSPKWRQQWHASCDKSFQAFPLIFVLQATKAGCGGLEMRLVNPFRIPLHRSNIHAHLFVQISKWSVLQTRLCSFKSVQFPRKVHRYKTDMDLIKSICCIAPGLYSVNLHHWQLLLYVFVSVYVSPCLVCYFNNNNNKYQVFMYIDGSVCSLLVHWISPFPPANPFKSVPCRGFEPLPGVWIRSQCLERVHNAKSTSHFWSWIWRMYSC